MFGYFIDNAEISKVARKQTNFLSLVIHFHGRPHDNYDFCLSVSQSVCLALVYTFSVFPEKEKKRKKEEEVGP